MTAPRPKQPVCWCELRLFPHREDHWCRIAREEDENFERMEKEAAEYDERERAKYINAVNRGVAK